MTTPFPTGTILGYPRIGRRRELKKAVEAFWAGSDQMVERLEQARLGSGIARRVELERKRGHNPPL